MRKTIASQLAFAAEACGRNGRSPRPDSEGRPVSRLSRIVAAIGERLRPPSAQRLSNHLRRDIGLDPLPERDNWPR